MTGRQKGQENSNKRAMNWLFHHYSNDSRNISGTTIIDNIQNQKIAIKILVTTRIRADISCSFAAFSMRK